MEKEVREERLLFAASDRDPPSLVEHLEWAKDPEVHPVLEVIAPPPNRTKLDRP